MKTYKHSGALGDLVYGLTIAKHFGPGKFYLHLNQIDWIGMNYYGSPPNPFHQGRMTPADFQYMRDFMLAQDYITSFEVLDPKAHEITHNLDKFRPVFAGHPTNYIDIYANVFGIREPEDIAPLRNNPWLSVPEPTPIPGRPIVINRTQRWIPPTPGEGWAGLRDQAEPRAVFVGLPQEYEAFKQQIGWDIPYHPTKNMLELASVIAGCENFIGNQSQCLALAVGLGVDWSCEARVDLPLERNECYFPDHPNGQYF